MNVKASILVTIGRRPLPRKRSPGFGSDRTSDQKGTPRPPDTDISRLITLQICAAGHIQANISIRISIRKISMALDYWGHGWPRSRSPLTGTSIFLFFFFFFSPHKAELRSKSSTVFIFRSEGREKKIKIFIFFEGNIITQDLSDHDDSSLNARSNSGETFQLEREPATDSSHPKEGISVCSDVIGISIRTFWRRFIQQFGATGVERWP